MPTISVENYLKAIYHLQQRSDDGLVKNKSIAQRLEISLPSVTAMLKSLAEDELVAYERYKGVSLTQKGRAQALNVIRKHRLIELFLVQTLQYSWDEVHAEAERLEHAISDELAARIETFLDFPSVDPHGDPIPSATGEVRASTATPMTQCEPPCQVQIERVLDQGVELLRYLESHSIMPGRRAHIVSIQPFDGQVTLQVERADTTLFTPVTLTPQTASRILVRACVVEEPSA